MELTYNQKLSIYKQKYACVDINALINYKAYLIRKANRLEVSLADLIKEFYS
jgi:hypothetical protein